MTMEAPIRYARSGDVCIAYRIFGDGPRDIVMIPGTISHVEMLWEVPSNKHLLKRLTAFARVIVFDKRGQGLSDRVAEQTLEERVGDVRAVMDAAGSERATIYGWSEGGPMCLMFAATYPARTSALVLFGTFTSMKGEPWMLTSEAFDQTVVRLLARWGEGSLLRLNAPSRRDDAIFLQWFAGIERAAASPGSVRALMRANYDIDVRHLLPTIQAPTLILHRAGDRLVPVSAGRYLAEHIPGARYVEIPGSDHLVLDQETQDIIADEIEEFITGTRQRLETDRVLATVMFHRHRTLHRTRRRTGRRAVARTTRQLLRGVAEGIDRIPRSRSEYRRRRLACHLRRPGARDPLRPFGAREDAPAGSAGSHRPAYR
jgi:pimeloyl-ACP methyl ester carboxylesterase